MREDVVYYEDVLDAVIQEFIMRWFARIHFIIKMS